MGVEPTKSHRAYTTHLIHFDLAHDNLVSDPTTDVHKAKGETNPTAGS